MSNTNGDYISRETIRNRLHRIIEVNRVRPDVAWFTPNGVEALIDEIHPADVRPVVLRRDCKRSSRNFEDDPLRCPKAPTELDEDGLGVCAPVPDDFWCKYGEPKDSGADMRLEDGSL